MNDGIGWDIGDTFLNCVKEVSLPFFSLFSLLALASFSLKYLRRADVERGKVAEAMRMRANTWGRLTSSATATQIRS